VPRLRHTVADLPPELVEAGLLRFGLNGGVGRDARERELLVGAESGDPVACRELGVLLDERGDAGEAENWLRAAVFFGDRYARTGMGVLLYRQEQYDRAMGWFDEAARDGDPVAARQLGRMLTANWGDGPLDAQAWATGVSWLRRAAGWDDADAAYALGCLLLARDDGAGRDWLRLAADAGHPDAGPACRQLGIDTDPLPPRARIALRLRLLGPDVREREAQLQERVASAVEPGGRLDGPAEQRLRGAADAGDSLALTALGVLLAEDRVLHAADAFRDAALRGDPLGARHFAGFLLTELPGIGPGAWEIGEAARWSESAAGQGDAEAAARWGRFLATSPAVTAEAGGEGRTWLLAAADAGHAGAAAACRELGIA
jgi:TPR repeat protein